MRPRHKKPSEDTHVNDEGPHFSKHAVPVVPDAVEAQHLAVKLEELARLVEGAGRLVGPQGLRLDSPLDVGVLGEGFGLVHL